MTGTENNQELLKLLMKTEIIEKTKREMDCLSWHQAGKELLKLQCTFGDSLKPKRALMTVVYFDVATVFIEITPSNSSQSSEKGPQ